MTPPILVTGGTGTLGRLVTPLLCDAGREVRVLTRATTRATGDGDGVGFGVDLVTGDLVTGEGVDAAVGGVETVVHLAGTAKGDEQKARTLVRAAGRAGVKHLVHISVVGADRVPVVSGVDRAMFGYFAAKRAAEVIVTKSGLPWTIVRATQFHDFVLALVRPLAKLPVVPYFAGVRFQPVDARDVAARLAELSLGGVAGLVPDLGGPRTYDMKDLVRSYLDATDRHRLTVPVLTPGQGARAYRAGANLSPGRAVGTRTWEAFLAERLRQSSTSITSSRR